ncbi:hypothetical protein [Reticulibacter mediterranei]|uniref:hypothetical protein n=1 Tax=Reticulibacter mediterranei TaxID=2778369 RepID=UPI001C691208|nr:hypothetical protein [Reticulibacter mediterranei]
MTEHKGAGMAAQHLLRGQELGLPTLISKVPHVLPQRPVSCIIFVDRFLLWAATSRINPLEEAARQSRRSSAWKRPARLELLKLLGAGHLRTYESTHQGYVTGEPYRGKRVIQHAWEWTRGKGSNASRQMAPLTSAKLRPSRATGAPRLLLCFQKMSLEKEEQFKVKKKRFQKMERNR